jgi:hypothetical protein
MIRWMKESVAAVGRATMNDEKQLAKLRISFLVVYRVVSR